jgi:hypothetical protein
VVLEAIAITRCSGDRVGELAGAVEGPGDAARLAVQAVLAGEAFEFAVAGDVALDEVDAVVVVDGDVHDGDAAVDALRVERALPAGDAVAAKLDRLARGADDRASDASLFQRALEP